MKGLLAAIAMVAFLGFSAFTHAADAPKTHTHHGTFVKADSTELTYKGMKAPNKEHTIKITDTTKVTLEGKDAKIADLKADFYLTITDEGGTATAISATAEAPKKPAAK
ncbi:MAG TPA: hypothetical protein VFC46_14160 [Humisphaera sp.]|nr:hypothetical protein [Humisphaera sp.]